MIALWLLILNKLQSIRYVVAAIAFDHDVHTEISVLYRTILLRYLIMRKLKSNRYDVASIADAIWSKRSGF
jgi:hypothetical protein